MSNEEHIHDPKSDELMDEYMEDVLEEDRVDFKRALLIAAVIAVALVGFTMLAWNAYKYGNQPKTLSELPIVYSDTSPYKVPPEHPGGMEIPNRDKSVYDVLTQPDTSALPKVERILPPPEEPLQRPVAAVEQNKVPAKAPAEAVASSKSEKVSGANKQAAVALDNTAAKTTISEENNAPKKIKASDLKKPEQPIELAKKPKIQNVYRIQLGAFRKQKNAIETWEKLRKKHGDIIQGLTYHIEKKNLGNKGVVFRLQAGPFESESRGRQVCKKLLEEKQGCFFVK